MAYTAINDPEAYFQVKIYSGTGSSQAYTLDGDTDMQPDLVWIKERSGTQNNIVTDAVRGTNKNLYSDGPDAEATTTDNITAFGSDGFTVAGTGNETNASGKTYVAWNWKAGGSASTDDAGTIDSSTSTSTTAGFSIATWTSTAAAHTIGHSLGVVPTMIIMKGRHESNSWQVYHHKNTAAPETDYLDLSTTDATADYTVWNDTAPTSSVMSLGTWSGLDDGGTMVAYIFAPKQGFSSMGSYTGNGNANGPFIYTGFRPAWFMTKRTDAVGDWRIRDVKREPGQPLDAPLSANSSAAENDGDNDWDVVSNGLKLRGSGTGENASGGTYVYMAFAEAPFVNSNGVPCNAR